VVIPEINSDPIEMIGDFEIYTILLTSVVVLKKETKLNITKMNPIITATREIGEIAIVSAKVTKSLNVESRKKLNKKGICPSTSETSEVHLLRMTPVGVVSKKLIGLLKMFHIIDLKMFREAEPATRPVVIEFIIRKRKLPKPIAPYINR